MNGDHADLARLRRAYHAATMRPEAVERARQRMLDAVAQKALKTYQEKEDAHDARPTGDDDD